MAWTVKRIYYSAGWVQGETLNTANLKISWRTNEAGKASFFVPGTSCPLQERDRVFITDGTKTWGGVVFNITQKKTGFQIECMDFLDALMGIEVTKTYENRTDVYILNDILSLQKVPALTLTLDSTGVTPKTFRKLEFKEYTAYQVLEFLSRATGNKYYSYQTAYNSAPVLRWFIPPGTSSGIVLDADNIYSDWSKSSPRTGIANRVKIKMNLPDVDVTGKETLIEGLIWGGMSTGLDVLTLNDSGKHYGFSFEVPPGGVSTDYATFYLRMRRVGNSYLQVRIRKPDSTEVAAYLGQPGGPTASWALIGAFNCFDQVGTYYIDLAAVGPVDANNYIQIYARQADSVKDGVRPGEGCNALNFYYNYGDYIWKSGATELIYANVVYQYLMAYLFFPPAGAITWSGQDIYGLDNGGNIFLAGENKIAKKTLGTPIRCADYPYLVLNFASVLKNGIAYIYFYTTDSDYYYKAFSFPKNSDYKLSVTKTDATGTVGSPDENNINKIGIKLIGVTSPTIIRQLYFEGSDYEKILEDTTSQQNYEQKLYTETVPFRYKDEVDDYAQKMLDALKNPRLSFSIRAKNPFSTPFIFTPYQTVDLTVGGGNYTPKVIGMDWECASQKTNFIFENYSVSSLSAILSALTQKG